MRALVQRVAEASVSVGDDVVGEIGAGLLIFLGVGPTDMVATARDLAGRVSHLRIFDDANGKMNLCLLDTEGSALVVSQFTLYADVTRGRRPSFTAAAKPDQAEKLVAVFADELFHLGVPVATGRFAARMRVRLVNDGPVTIWLDTEADRRQSPAP